MTRARLARCEDNSRGGGGLRNHFSKIMHSAANYNALVVLFSLEQLQNWIGMAKDSRSPKSHTVAWAVGVVGINNAFGALESFSISSYLGRGGWCLLFAVTFHSFLSKLMFSLCREGGKIKFSDSSSEKFAFSCFEFLMRGVFRKFTRFSLDSKHTNASQWTRKCSKQFGKYLNSLWVSEKVISKQFLLPIMWCM